jgi:hypothetical protein
MTPVWGQLRFVITVASVSLPALISPYFRRS